MRTLVPAETLVYLETNDLAAALQPIVDSKPFTEVATSKPDFSALKGVQVAVAVTGFETSEEKVNDEQSIGRVRPRFVAVVDTHAWNNQAMAFVEHKLGSFVRDIYNAEPQLEKSDKHGGKYFTWTAADGRKAYALVTDSLIWFGNDETAIDKCLAVRRGEAESLITTGKVQAAEPGTLARGYVSTDGVAQIASLASVKVAAESTEDPDIRSSVVAVLPELIRSSASDLSWVSRAASPAIEDRFSVTRPQPVEKGNELVAELVDSFFDDLEGLTAEEVVAVLGVRRTETATAPNTVHQREDRRTATTAERRINSDLGFFGWLIAQLSEG
ncbi:MAG: hypothetical protein IPM59_06625 [Chloracidobacterium sp.]|nr:hypothetical protein [Chloracidobacterium sp.]